MPWRGFTKYLNMSFWLFWLLRYARAFTESAGEPDNVGHLPDERAFGKGQLLERMGHISGQIIQAQVPRRY
jgi:hypothetical protein